MQFHITFDPPTPTLPNWPTGFWALYEITGDQIAERTVFKEIAHGNIGPHYRGGIIARHSWCGYIGAYGSFAEVAAEINKRIEPK